MFENKFDWNTIATVSAVLVQIIGFGIAFVVIHFQFKKQRDIESENFKNSVNIGFYKDLISKMNDLSLSSVTYELSLLIEQLQFAFASRILVPNEKIKDLQSNEFDKKYIATQTKLSGISEVLDSYSIVLPNIQLFKQFLSDKIGDYESKVSSLKSSIDYKYVTAFRVNNDGESDENAFGEMISGILLKHREIAILSKEIENWIYDIKIEIQNKLLGDYFGRYASLRKNDKSGIVLTSTDNKMISLVSKEVAASLRQKNEKNSSIGQAQAASLKSSTKAD